MSIKAPPLWLLTTSALALLVFSSTVAQASFSQAAAEPVLMHPGQAKPKPVIVMSRKLAQQTALLSSDEVASIKTLQSAVMPNIVSDISPGGKTVVLRVDDPTAPKASAFYLLDTPGGKQRPIDSRRLQGLHPDYFYWRDAETAIALVSKQDKEQEKQYALILVARQTGAVKVKSLHLPGEPLSLAPNGSRVLVQLTANGKITRHDRQDSKDDDAELPPKEQATELAVVGAADGKEQYRFTVPPKSYPPDVDQAIAWTPDGSKLAIVRSWIQDDDDTDSSGERLSSPLTQDAMGLLRPADNPFLQENALLTINLTTKQQALLQASAGDGAVFSNIVWSPDGKVLLVRMLDPITLKGRPYPIYTFSEHGSFRFYDDQLHEVSRLEVPELANADPDDTSDMDQVQGQFISSDEVLFTALSGMNTQLYRYNRASGNLRHLDTQAGSEGDVVGSIATNQILFSYSSYTTPPEIYRMAWDGSQPAVPLTSFNAKAAALSQIRADTVSFTLTDGETFDGILLQPRQASFPPHNIPLVVWQEGGPMSDVNNIWSADVERPFDLLPHFGIAVLIVPLYGRYGFGTDRFNALYTGQNFGRIDIDAMAEIVQQAIRRGYTSPQKVGITGCSYGGYFTLQSLTRHPHLYAAANTQCSLIDSADEWNVRSRGGASFDYGTATPYTNAAKFQQDSPIYNAKQLQTPLLIFHGSNDFLPVNLMENFYWAIASQGVSTRMVKFVGAGHGLVDSQTSESIPEYELYGAQEMIQWFRTYLQREPVKGSIGLKSNQ